MYAFPTSTPHAIFSYLQDNFLSNTHTHAQSIFVYFAKKNFLLKHHFFLLPHAMPTIYMEQLLPCEAICFIKY